MPQFRVHLRSKSIDRPNHFPVVEHNEHSPSNLKISSRVILYSPIYNKGTAFSDIERRKIGIEGLLPEHVESLELQLKRAMRQYNRFADPVDKHIYLSNIRNRNTVLFYNMVVQNLEEMMPIIYTPTVGAACIQFDHEFRQAEGMYVSLRHMGRVREILGNWTESQDGKVDVIVITDGSRILGLGDLGINGMGIPIGKLSLYVAAGGFHPANILPITVDVGTNNETYLKDDLYLGLRQQRCNDETFFNFFDEITSAIKEKWPECLLQFEDFSNNHCFAMLDKYRNKLRCFNDDIQGTGAVVAAGFFNAVRLSGVPANEHKLLFVGGGSAGVGVADQIMKCFVALHGLSEADAKEKIYMADSKGLIGKSRTNLQSFKLAFQRHDIDHDGDLLDLVRTLKPTTIVGLSGQAQLFDQDIVGAMAECNKRPIIMALSNPTNKAECTLQDAIKWSEGRCIHLSGSPMGTATYDGRNYPTNQGNNLYIFPGLGFGTWLCEARAVTDSLVTAATIALTKCTTPADLANNQVYPSLSYIRDISAGVAATVIMQAYAEGLTSKVLPCDTSNFEELQSFVASQMYSPEYHYWER
ncbi:MAG: hypothetical protein KVP17_003644 [Porospora cf. gigantea B]|uniref:uncharacterized protein n=1 Tax=Porospora cf. gigantea B TaxID=2853592 RepID=UPI0035717B7F|nr:MAG: hypothetical protein KVP17_003644 [Porospora cf. gigantea B]